MSLIDEFGEGNSFALDDPASEDCSCIDCKDTESTLARQLPADDRPLKEVRSTSASRDLSGEAGSNPPLLATEIGRAVLTDLCNQLRQAYTSGGVETVDKVIVKINDQLSAICCRYWLGPAAHCPEDDCGSPSVLIVPCCYAGTYDIVQIYRIVLPCLAA